MLGRPLLARRIVASTAPRTACWRRASTRAAAAPLANSDFRPAMDRALELARRAASEGEVPVGAVVLAEAGGVLGEGRNAAGAAHRHAEVEAMEAAVAAAGRRRLDGSTLVVTLEPCSMCVSMAATLHVSTIVYAASSAKYGACGGRLDLPAAMADAGLPHVPAVRRLMEQSAATEAAGLLVEYFRAKR